MIKVYWFRKALRLHDNPGLVKCISAARRAGENVACIFIFDPWFAKNGNVGHNRWCFLQQSLNDLQKSLDEIGSRLYVIRGGPFDVFENLLKSYTISTIYYEIDTEPYALERDTKIDNMASKKNIEVVKIWSHTLYDLDRSIDANGGQAPKTYSSFCNLMKKLGDPLKPVEAPSKDELEGLLPESFLLDDNTGVPDHREMGIPDSLNLKYPGGESVALSRMECYLQKQEWICKFEKPNTSPNSIKPSTTVLSPYLKFGCLSARLFYHRLDEVTKNKKHSQPPVSLHGQLIWREFFYTVAYDTPKFDKMVGNSLCKQIAWEEDDAKLQAWKHGKTGYPFIDAIMRQLAQEGWIHHLARHAVACFLTRGDLYQSWEKGVKVFEEYLLDADWALNAANWQWLSASTFFHQYYRVYSPVAFGKKTDKKGDYIRKYVPELKDYPTEYIYEPWKAPPGVQKSCKCIIGTDYPYPIVDHDKVKDENIAKMKKSYGNQPSAGAKSSKKRKIEDSILESVSTPTKRTKLRPAPDAAAANIL